METLTDHEQDNKRSRQENVEVGSIGEFHQVPTSSNSLEPNIATLSDSCIIDLETLILSKEMGEPRGITIGSEDTTMKVGREML